MDGAHGLRWQGARTRQPHFDRLTANGCGEHGRNARRRFPHATEKMHATRVRATDGLAFRFEQPAQAMLTAGLRADGDDRCGLIFRMTQPRAAACGLRNSNSATTRVLLWGNSHAAMWAGVFEALAHEHDAAFYLTAKNCRATADSRFCGASHQAGVLKEIQEHQISDVVLISSWYGAYGIPDEKFEAELTSIVERLHVAGVRVWLSVDIPVGPELSPSAAYKQNPDAPGWGVLDAEAHDKVRQRELALFRTIQSVHTNVHILDPTYLLCTPSAGCPSGEHATAYYRDGSHLTSAGAARARQVYEEVFRR